MTSFEQTASWPQLQGVFEKWYLIAHAQLDKAYQLSPHLRFDDNSRLFLSSDLHRGVNNRDDAFAPNAGLFLHTLTHYYNQDFTYIEVGDGDELWHNRHFHDIRSAYHKIFDLFTLFKKKDRLHLIVGNHDSLAGMFDPMEKDGIPMHQGLVLKHTKTGQSLFAVHGHQADPAGDRLWWFGRLQSRYFWKHALALGLDKCYHLAEPEPQTPFTHRLERLPYLASEWILNKARRLEGAIHAWMSLKQQIVISGHTHMPNFPILGQLPFFNTGNGVTPGYITGLEIQQGEIALVKWTRQKRPLYTPCLAQTAPVRH